MLAQLEDRDYGEDLIIGFRKSRTAKGPSNEIRCAARAKRFFLRLATLSNERTILSQAK